MRRTKAVSGRGLVNISASCASVTIGMRCQSEGLQGARLLKTRKERKEKLDAIGFLWDAKDSKIDRQWLNKCERLFNYYVELGNSNVP